MTGFDPDADAVAAGAGARTAGRLDFGGNDLHRPDAVAVAGAEVGEHLAAGLGALSGIADDLDDVLVDYLRGTRLSCRLSFQNCCFHKRFFGVNGAREVPLIAREGIRGVIMELGVGGGVQPGPLSARWLRLLAISRKAMGFSARGKGCSQGRHSRRAATVASSSHDAGARKGPLNS